MIRLGGNQGKHRPVAAFAVDDDRHPERPTQTEQNEAFLVVRMIRIGEEQRFRVFEHGAHFRERDAVLGQILRRFAGIPVERRRGHT